MTDLYTVEFEVNGGQTGLAREFLINVDLSKIERLRVEAASTTPFTLEAGADETEADETGEYDGDREPHETQQSKADFDDDQGNGEEETADDEQVQVEITSHDRDDEQDEPAKPTGAHTCLCGQEFDSVKGLGAHSRWCSEWQDADEHEREQAKGQPAESESDDEPSLDTVNLKPGTNKWTVAGVLYRKQGYLSTGAIVEILADTAFEMQTNNVSATIATLIDEGLADKEETTGKWPSYQLTQFGRDAMEHKIKHADDYPMTRLDKSLGIHPTA